jgi:hypothetical protein
LLAALLPAALLLLAACAPPATRPPLPAQATVTLPAAIAGDPAALVTAERNAAAARDLATLALLWDEEATLTEVRGAGGDDDYRWAGRAAILDRYEVAVFPAPPPPLDAPLVLAVAQNGDQATVLNGIDSWQFVRRDGRWWIASLVIGPP